MSLTYCLILFCILVWNLFHEVNMRRNTARFIAITQMRPGGRHMCTFQPWNLLVERRRRKCVCGRRRVKRAGTWPEHAGTPHRDHLVTESGPIASPSLPLQAVDAYHSDPVVYIRVTCRSTSIGTACGNPLTFYAHAAELSEWCDVAARLLDTRTAAISTLLLITVASRNVKYGPNVVQLCVRPNSPTCTQSPIAHCGIVTTLWHMRMHRSVPTVKLVVWPMYVFTERRYASAAYAYTAPAQRRVWRTDGQTDDSCVCLQHAGRPTVPKRLHTTDHANNAVV